MIDIDKTNVKIIDMTDDGTYGKVVVEPLERGFGVTLGNSLRRVMLSSLAGAAVTSIKIEGVQHEFATIPGVKEDVAEIVLNIKNLRFKLYGAAPKRIYIEAHGKGEVTAADIKYDPEIDVLSTEQHIATLSEDASLVMELTVSEGKGYVSAEKNKQDAQPEIGRIAVDSIYTPVVKVNYSVENTRVGQITDYDKLILEAWTDGSVSAKEAVSIAAKILVDHLELLMELSNIVSDRYKHQSNSNESNDKNILDITLEEMNLSVRAFNCLKRVGVNNLKDLLKMSEEEILKIKNLGKKSLNEVILKVEALGFKMFDDDKQDQI
ncbi:MAG: DNA-directed RNA polymerase subunit alpha [Oscillospiraceae bacterium]|nr:DNA-directed RNA polymerase subunit alpha [Oscillospiraceae bacterium]